MKITVTKVKKILVEKYGWSKGGLDQDPSLKTIIDEILSIVNNILQEQKGIKIK